MMLKDDMSRYVKRSCRADIVRDRVSPDLVRGDT